MSAPYALAGLRRLRGAGTADAPGGRCRRCGEPLAEEHGHVADLESRSLHCVCPRCHAALAVEAGATRRAVPRRYLELSPPPISEEDWNAFEIPVGIAFFFFNSSLRRCVAAYPSPAGAIESLLPAEAWERVLRSSPATGSLLPDVEAVLVRRTREADECFIVPIDACYELAGRIRRRWSGFGGGPEAQQEIAAFFADLRGRCEAVPA